MMALTEALLKEGDEQTLTEKILIMVRQAADRQGN